MARMLVSPNRNDYIATRTTNTPSGGTCLGWNELIEDPAVTISCFMVTYRPHAVSFWLIEDSRRIPYP